MLKENKKILESNTLVINRLEKEVYNYKQAILEELQKEKIYKTVLDRKSEKKHNKRLKNIVLSDLALFMIPFNHFRQIIPSIDFVNDSVGLILVVAFMATLSGCWAGASIKSLRALEHLIEREEITRDEVKKLLSLEDSYLNIIIKEVPQNIEEMKNELAELEEVIPWFKEYNTKIRKINKLEEKVLNDKLIKQELESEFDEFLNEYNNPEDVHFNNELEQPLTLTFANK